MIYLQELPDTLEQDVVEAAGNTAQALLSGDTEQISTFAQQAMSYCISAGKSILVAVIIYVVGRWIIGLINKVVRTMLAKRNLDPSIQTFLRSFVNITLTVLLIVTVVSALGVDTTSFAALLASLGLAFGMALSGNLQNFAGGLLILLFKPFRLGDYIEAQGSQGVVQKIEIFHTTILTVDNKIVILPNGALSSGVITNYSDSFRRVDLTISAEYGSDIEKVKQALMEIIGDNELVLTDQGHEPFVGLVQLNSSSVDYTVRAWCKGSDYWTVYFQLQESIYAGFQKRGIAFPYPQITVHQA